MGPFELMDLIGLDVNLATSEAIHERSGEARLEPVDLQYAMVTQGRLGRKSGSGFYDYSQGVPRHDDSPPSPSGKNDSERVVVTGYGPLADEIAELLAQHYVNTARIENDDMLEDISPDATIVVEAGDGINDRTAVLRTLDSILPPEVVLFVDAYATNVSDCAKTLNHSERLVGFGVVGSLDRQEVVEIVDSEQVSDDALELAQELFADVGKRVVLVEDGPALFLGRVVASIINEAVVTVRDNVASADDVDTAMRLGTNYPIGPIEWGREIGGGRVRRILEGLAAGDGDRFAPDRALWVLDAELAEQQEEGPPQSATRYDG
jgi:3-hydroxybutyryl-CoA dehydrogenase